uniref:Uncharacterized protein n=1 Tax=Hyaloperonospora arabidopsidis (strain Emoy2) TaxID=559515 RepID=M4BS93_HYAAE
MKTACQKLATSRWEYISKVGGWFKAKRVRVRAYFAERTRCARRSNVGGFTS